MHGLCNFSNERGITLKEQTSSQYKRKNICSKVTCDVSRSPITIATQQTPAKIEHLIFHLKLSLIHI